MTISNGSGSISKLSIVQYCHASRLFVVLRSDTFAVATEKEISIEPGFYYTANSTTTTPKQSDYKVEQSSFTLIALF